MDKWDKELQGHIKVIQKRVRALKSMGLKIEIAKDVETMTGGLTDHIYVMDYIGNTISLQKHLFSV